jgi:hypothetical protein
MNKTAKEFAGNRQGIVINTLFVRLKRLTLLFKFNCAYIYIIYIYIFTSALIAFNKMAPEQSRIGTDLICFVLSRGAAYISTVMREQKSRIRVMYYRKYDSVKSVQEDIIIRTKR